MLTGMIFANGASMKQSFRIIIMGDPRPVIGLLVWNSLYQNLHTT